MHAKLIDDDELSYPPALLHEWRDTSEHMAALEARGFAIRRASPFPDLERKMPALVAEMRADLTKHPLTRQFIIMSKNWSYNGGRTPLFMYFLEDHPDLPSMMTIMEHKGAIYSIKFNNVDRYNFNEDFVDYLLG